MRRIAATTLCGFVVLVGGSFWPGVGIDAAGGPGLAQSAGTAASAPSRALLDRYCITCHNERLRTADLTLDTLDIGQVAANAEVLEKIVHKLRSGQMPPQGRPRPGADTVESFVAALEAALDASAAVAPDPGRVASRRLNRTEYVYAVRDLLDLEIDGDALLPSDMAGFGFDNNADVLSVTPTLMSRYLSAATKISRVAVGSLANRPVVQIYKPPNYARQTDRMGEDLPFGTHGGLAVRHVAPLDGEYLLKVRLQRGEIGESIVGNIAEKEYEIEVRVDHALVARLSVGGEFKGRVRYTLSGGGIGPPDDDVEGRQIAYYNQTADEDLEVRLSLQAGPRLLSVALTDIEPSASPGIGDTVVAGIGSIEVRGPYDGTVPEKTPSRDRIFLCHPASNQEEAACARQIIGTLARRAYRRPVDEADIRPLMEVFAQGRAGHDFEAGIERVVEALLNSPKFLFRIEDNPVDLQPGTAYRISDLELASRLSFFLWRSIPDDELIDVAAQGRLREPSVLREQVERMMADERSSRWMRDFVGQWLQIRNLETIEPDPSLFPAFDGSLREAMLRETELFFESQVREDRSVLDLLRADYTFLNARLAEHYRIPNVYGSHFRRVVMPDAARVGLLGHGSVLTVTSYADRTSVVLRGKWVLETLLGAPPPPPPPNVPPLEENDGRGTPTSLRERMEQHRGNPVCASCHAQMDPLGFALENFNAIGAWRETDAGAPIDPAITLSDVQVDGPPAFRAALLSEKGDEFLRTIVEKVLTYALGRGLTYADAPTVRAIVRQAATDEVRWSSLISAIVGTDVFQMRTVRDPDEAESDSSVVAAR